MGDRSTAARAHPEAVDVQRGLPASPQMIERLDRSQRILLGREASDPGDPERGFGRGREWGRRRELPQRKGQIDGPAAVQPPHTLHPRAGDRHRPGRTHGELAERRLKESSDAAETAPAAVLTLG
jgi:hypothetical protein